MYVCGNERIHPCHLSILKNNFRVEIAVPVGLTTNYRKTFSITYAMIASAEIVTDDLRMIENVSSCP